ncbi:MAG: hypothetical protein WCO29_22570 [Nostocales cyanobacterium ELA583]|jgi:hypothetical protein
MNHLTPEERQEIQDLLSLDESLLYSLLPYHLHDGTQYSPQGQIEVGRKIFAEIKPTIHRRVCKDWNGCEKIKNEQIQDNVALVTSIADLIAGSCGGMPAFTLATIVVKIGIKQICNC